MAAHKLSAVQLAAAAALGGAVVMAMLPPFFRNLNASRVAEPMKRLNEIAGRANARAASQPVESAYPESAPLTPSSVPRGELVTDPPGTWDHPTWRLLSFQLNEPHAFSYAFESRNGERSSSFRAIAHGDLDGDGTLSTFLIEGRSASEQSPNASPVAMHREVE